MKNLKKNKNNNEEHLVTNTTETVEKNLTHELTFQEEKVSQHTREENLSQEERGVD